MLYNEVFAFSDVINATYITLFLDVPKLTIHKKIKCKVQNKKFLIYIYHICSNKIYTVKLIPNFCNIEII